ncbi:MAG: hypothetical protein JXA15_08475 [Spirochaetales bacterium]|nr:hypothetical protein [Spirochaetales bacterium]
MNLKKLLAAVAVLFLLGSAAFADVRIKDEGSGKVAITFTHKDDAATEMAVIGSFNSWVEPGEPMARNADGLWELTIEASVEDEIVYKFFSKGSYIFDFKAPDKKDDGFGGNNGLIVVADVLAMQAAGVSSASGGSAAAVVPLLPGARKKLAFGTFAFVESDTRFDTTDGFDAVQSTVDAKSVWKLEGDVVGKMPAFFEITFFDGSTPVWEDGVTPLGDGLESLASGFVFNPAFWLGAEARPSLDKFRFGFDTKYVAYETGYGETWLPGRESVLWETVEVEGTSAGLGYSSFRLGSELREIGDFSFDAALVPNRSLNDFYGLYAWAKAAYGDYELDFQYDLRSLTKTEPLEIFEVLTRQDYIVGARGYIGMLGLSGQFLLSRFTPGGTAEALPFTDKMAAALKIDYADFFELWDGYVEARYRGSAAQLLYLDADGNAEELGDPETLGLDLGGSIRLGHWLRGKLDAGATLSSVDLFAGNIAVAARPGLTVDVSLLAKRPLTAELYADLSYDTVPDAGKDAFNFIQAGLAAHAGDLLPGLLETVDLWYGLSNGATMWNSLLAELGFAHGISAQIGGGFRSGGAVTNPMGALLGAAWVVPAPQAKSPTVYAQFVWNMDPYDAEDITAFDLTDDLPSSGVAASETEAALRFGITWNF